MTTDPAPAARRGDRALVLALLLGALLAVAGCRPTGTPGGGTEAAPREEAVAATDAASTARQVRTVEAISGALDASRSTSVTVEPSQEAQVAAGASGQVAAVLRREGSVVEAGDVVVRLDAENARLQAQNARIAVESARVNLQKAQNASREGEQQAQRSLRSAETSLDLARRQYEQGRQLFDKGAIAEVELTGLEAQYEQAQATLQQAQNAVAQSGRAGGEDLELLRLQLEQAQTQLAQSERAVRDADVRAPFAGEVAATLVEEGEFIGAGSPAFRLVSTERQLARFSVPPSDAAPLLAQGLVYLRYDGLDYAAQIARSSEVAGASRLVELTAEIYPSETRIPTGAVAELRYDVELASGVLLPSGAVRTSGGESGVFVVEDGRAVRRNVRVLAEAGGRAAVSGLDEGAAVVYPLPADLRPDVAVSVVADGGVADGGER